MGLELGDLLSALSSNRATTSSQATLSRFMEAELETLCAIALCVRPTHAAPLAVSRVDDDRLIKPASLSRLTARTVSAGRSANSPCHSFSPFIVASPSTRNAHHS